MLVVERTVSPVTGRPPLLPAIETDTKLNIAVVFTSVETTLAALKEAGKLANDLGARIRLLVPQVVPYPLSLESPPVSVDWNEKRFHVIASESLVETAVQIYLCRDRTQALESMLGSSSIVVVGSRKRRWPTSEKRLASKLRKAGRQVILAETE